MYYSTLLRQDILVWVILPLLIFLAGLIFVSLGTLRIIFVAKGRRYLSPLLGFFEVIIWLIAISQVISNVSNIATYFTYAAGFAVGNYVGILIEEKMAIGILIVRIIVTMNDEILRNKLRDAGFGVTSFDGKGSQGNVNLIFTVVKRKDLSQVINIINESHTNAFYSIEDARSVVKGVFPKKII